MVDGPFREALESQSKDNIALFHLVHFDDLKHLCIFGRFQIFFQGFGL
jgi:hypothetical protein